MKNFFSFKRRKALIIIHCGYEYLFASLVIPSFFLPLPDLSHAQPSYAGLKGGGGGSAGGVGGSGSDEAIRSILEQARREMEAQQAALEPILKASSSSSSSSSTSSLSQRDLLSSPLTAPLPPYNPLALSLKKPSSSLLSSPSSPSPILDFSTSVKREGRASSGMDMSVDGALRLGRGSEGRSGSSGGVGYWREQWWSNMPTDHRRAISSQTGEDNQEDSKEVSGVRKNIVGVCVCVCGCDCCPCF